MKCTNCGNELPEGTSFCTGCGQVINSGNITQAQAGAVPAAGEGPVLGQVEVLWQGRYSLQDMNLVWFGTSILTILFVVLGILLHDTSRLPAWMLDWRLWIAVLALPIVYWIFVFQKLVRWDTALLVTAVFVAAGLMAQFHKELIALPVLQRWGILLAVPLLFWIWAACVGIYRSTIHYRLTPHRLYKSEGIFIREEDALELWVVRDIAKRQSLLERFLCGGVGTIRIHSPDPTDPVLDLRGLKDFKRAFELIDAARQKARATRGIVTDA